MEHNIGDAIKKRRIQLHMSQEELARLTGYSGRSAIAKIERSVNGLPQKKVTQFAKALRTSELFLCGTVQDPEWKMPVQSFELSADEKNIIEKFRSAEPEKQKIIRYLLET